MRENNNYLIKRICLIVGVAILILGLSAGFAALSTRLSINGKTKINKVGWDIRFENIVVSDGSVEIGEGSQGATINPTDKTKVSYNVILTQPGDFYEFTVDVVNKGSIDAKLESIVKDGLTAEQEVYANYSVSYVDGTSPTIGEQLKTGDANKKTLKVRIEFDHNIEAEDLPSEAQTFELSYQLNYVQNK